MTRAAGCLQQFSPFFFTFWWGGNAGKRSHGMIGGFGQDQLDSKQSGDRLPGVAPESRANQFGGRKLADADAGPLCGNYEWEKIEQWSCRQGRGVIERVKPLIKEMIPPQWRWEEKMQEPAGWFGGVVRNDSSSQLWRSMRTTHPRSQVISCIFFSLTTWRTGPLARPD